LDKNVSEMFYSTTSFLQNLSFCTWHIFLFPSFADPLGYFLFNCRIFIKLSINQVLQSLKIIIWYNKNIIWYRYLLLFDRVFSELLEETLTNNFLGIEVGLKLFFICLLEMVVGPL